MFSAIGIYKQNKIFYSERPPYFPPAMFQEYPFSDSRVDKKNETYASLRELLKLLGLDLQNFCKKSWNPLGTFIMPGQTVLLKPNLVRDSKIWSSDASGLITHGSLIRAVADYTYIALKGKGRIIIADGPMDDADMDKIIGITGLKKIKDFYKDTAGFDLEIYDLRKEHVIRRNGEIVNMIPLKGDPAGYTSIDLGAISEFRSDALDYSM